MNVSTQVRFLPILRQVADFWVIRKGQTNLIEDQRSPEFDTLVKYETPTIHQVSRLKLQQFLRYLSDKVKMPKITKGHNS